MGLFSDFRGASKQKERLLQLKSEIVATALWREIYNSPLIGSGIRIGFATVDCRNCGKTDAGLLLEQTIWNWQTHKMSFATCIAKPLIWHAEMQGPQRPPTKLEWLSANWSSYDEAIAQASNMEGRQVVGTKQFDSVEEWILTSFLKTSQTIKRKLAVKIRTTGPESYLDQLEEFIRIENLDI